MRLIICLLSELSALGLLSVSVRRPRLLPARTTSCVWHWISVQIVGETISDFPNLEMMCGMQAAPCRHLSVRLLRLERLTSVVEGDGDAEPEADVLALELSEALIWRASMAVLAPAVLAALLPDAAALGRTVIPETGVEI